MSMKQSNDVRLAAAVGGTVPNLCVRRRLDRAGRVVRGPEGPHRAPAAAFDKSYSLEVSGEAVAA